MSIVLALTILSAAVFIIYLAVEVYGLIVFRRNRKEDELQALEIVCTYRLKNIGPIIIILIAICIVALLIEL